MKSGLSQTRATGFTLIELVVTVAIVGILATLVFPMAEISKRRTKEQELHTALRTIREAIDNYKRASDENHILRKIGDTGYPQNLELLVDGVEDAKSPDHRKLYFLRRIPRDPFNLDMTMPPERTWGKRSSSSPADAPKEGNDVFDVYSLAEGKGTDGIPYKDW